MNRWLIRLASILVLTGFVSTGSAFAANWVPVANRMQDERWAPSFALLPSPGGALIAGGYSFAAKSCVATVDLFDLKTNRFAPSRARLTYPRDFAPAVSLNDGRVLIAGGFNTELGTLDTAEIYDPVTDTVRVLPSKMSVGRELFTATVLLDGRVLVAGGFDIASRGTQSSADLFDPATNTFHRVISNLSYDRFGHSAVRLADGRVLIVGGSHWRVGKTGYTHASAEIFDPATGRFHVTSGAMAIARDRPTTTLMRDGTVLVVGGQTGKEAAVIAEVFDPKTERFTRITGPLAVARMAHSDCLLSDGRALVAGGWCPSKNATTDTVELFDPALHTFAKGPLLPTSSLDQALLCFPNGAVLFAGGKHVTAGVPSSIASGAVWQPSAP